MRAGQQQSPHGSFESHADLTAPQQIVDVHMTRLLAHAVDTRFGLLKCRGIPAELGKDGRVGACKVEPNTTRRQCKHGKPERVGSEKQPSAGASCRTMPYKGCHGSSGMSEVPWRQ